MAEVTGAYLISEDDAKALHDLRRQSTDRRLSTQGRPEVPRALGYAPEVYVARTPSGGIPGLTPAGSGTAPSPNPPYDSPGHADCYVSRTVFQNGVPYLYPVEGLFRTVCNLSTNAVAGNIWVLAQRDKYGTWWAESQSEILETEFFKACPIYGTGALAGIVVGIKNEFRVKKFPSGETVGTPWCIDNPVCCPVETGTGSPCCPGVNIPLKLCFRWGGFTVQNIYGLDCGPGYGPSGSALLTYDPPNLVWRSGPLVAMGDGTSCFSDQMEVSIGCFSLDGGLTSNWYLGGGFWGIGFNGNGGLHQVAVTCDPFYTTYPAMSLLGGSEPHTSGGTFVGITISSDITSCNTGTGINCRCHITNAANQSSGEGQVISLFFTATGCTAPVTWTATGLPPGLVMNPVTGEVTGTVNSGDSASSPYDVTVHVSDSQGCSDMATFFWAVHGCTCTITNPGTQTNAIGDVVNLVLATTGSCASPEVWGTGGLPDGLTINMATGAITGTISLTATVETYAINVLVIDANGCESTVNFLWVVNNPPCSLTPTALGTTNNTSTATTTLTLTTASVTAGDLVVATITLDGAIGTPVTTVTYNGSTMSLDLAELVSAGAVTSEFRIVSFKALSTAAGSIVVTITGGSAAITIQAVQVHGLLSGVKDRTAGSVGASSSPDSGTTSATTYFCEFCYTAFVLVVPSGIRTWAGGFSAIQSQSPIVGVSTVEVIEGYKLLSSTGTVDASITGETALHWAGGVVTYK